jgi:hypothetical protein
MRADPFSVARRRGKWIHHRIAPIPERRFFAMQNDVPPDESSPLSSGVISSGKAGLLTSELM